MIKKKNLKVLVVATSRKTRGGITSVIKAHEQGEQWEKYQCKWIETQIDRNIFVKIYYLITSFFQFVFLVPFYNIVHVHTATSTCIILKSPFIFISKLLHKKIILHLHIGNQIDGYIGHFFFKYILRNADVIVVLSHNIEYKLKSIFNVKNEIQVIYNPCNYVEVLDFKNRGKNILFAGILNQNKGYEDLIKAFALIAKKYPEWKVILAGNGEINQAKELVKLLNLELQVEIKGWVTGKEKEIIFQNASVYCLASYNEGFPMSVLEAWAYGIPVICTPVGGLPDIVVDRENALIFNSGDTLKLASQLELIISNIQLREHIAEQSIKLSETTFKLENINNQIGDLYGSIYNK